MPSTRHNLTLDEQSFQSLLWAAFTIQEFNNRKSEGTVMVPGAKPAELFDCVPNPLLQELVQQALQATHATGAAIGLKQQGELICRATAGDFASEIGAVINAGSGFTGLCISSRTMQLCNNTALDSRVDADACQKLGVSSIIIVPLAHQDQVLGLIAVFSRRPYAFGIRNLQALQGLAEKCAASLQLSAGPAN